MVRYKKNIIKSYYDENDIKSKIIKIRGSKPIYNIPFSFDIETSSWEDDDNKKCCMYIWQMAINNFSFYGRTWKEFGECIHEIIDVFNTTKNDLIIWVHNLSFEFQFVKDRFIWENVFATEMRKVVYAKSDNGITFRCSYFLTNKSLEKSAEDLVNSDIRKLTGSLDYKKVRHAETELTDDELLYCEYDVLALNEIIKQKIEYDGNIAKIPLTNTGYVRKYIRDKCLFDKERKPGNRISYKIKIEDNKIEKYDNYMKYKEAFLGGSVIVNNMMRGKVIENVKSKDICSSYPYVLVTEEYPYGQGIDITKDIIENPDIIKDKIIYGFSIWNVELSDLKAKNLKILPLMKNKCFSVKKIREYENRIVSADKVNIILTNIDLDIVLKYYDCNIAVSEVIEYDTKFLPIPFVNCVLDFYEQKTTLKGVKGKEMEYQHFKGMLNSCFGMCVENICREEIDYKDGKWVRNIDEMETAEEINKEYEKQIAKNDAKKGRFLYYLWGIACTAYARRNLYKMIQKMGDNFLYCDTDSIKYISDKKLDREFLDENERILSKVNFVADLRNIDRFRFSPCSIDGEIHTIGLWEDDGLYKRFKMIGSKRYMYEDETGVHTTIAGVGKEKARQFFANKKDPFGSFKIGCVIPAEYSGKLCATYIDEKQEGTVTDYKGNLIEYEEMSGVHMEGIPYEMRNSDKFGFFENLTINSGFYNNI